MFCFDVQQTLRFSGFVFQMFCSLMQCEVIFGQKFLVAYLTLKFVQFEMSCLDVDGDALLVLPADAAQLTDEESGCLHVDVET